MANLEIATDHAMLPFGAGARKCVGDQFALLEAAVSSAMLLRRFGAGPWTRVNWQARPQEPPQDYYLRSVRTKQTRAVSAVCQPSTPQHLESSCGSTRISRIGKLRPETMLVSFKRCRNALA